ncbi:NIPSNAP protein [Saccharopolyspora shandongensis]|uniref:NIPSNAP protein n=1 Tax=Saccharopolyspora shandongensis TaxID=418495 RepID=A0A1H3N833_9PSEU|nr:NIPSNAP family protein [Saccharopolyspora shandongensis]SDY85111.1 NIPSNAP protein [Saccharopolyspora shandongensis]
MTEQVWCGVVELRQYMLKPGQRDVLIELFERELVEPQEALGMRIIGTFRDLDDPDRFVWLRGFADMAARHASLTGFYHGPVWAEHREAANATMVDSDDVLLLRPCGPFTRPKTPGKPVTVTVSDRHVTGSQVVATLRSEHAPNTFPALPVRENEDVAVTVAVQDNSPEPSPETLRLEPTARSWLR